MFLLTVNNRLIFCRVKIVSCSTTRTVRRVEYVCVCVCVCVSVRMCVCGVCVCVCKLASRLVLILVNEHLFFVAWFSHSQREKPSLSHQKRELDGKHKALPITPVCDTSKQTNHLSLPMSFDRLF